MKASDFGKVAVLMGGQSAEREVSLKSGQCVLDALRSKKIDAHGLDVGSNVIGDLTAGNYDRVFNVLHGRGGEDGVIQAVLESLGLPYTGSSVLGSALSMDKLRTKLIWKSQGIQTPAFCVLHEDTDFNKVVDELGLPVIVKPVHEGSSIGMSKVDTVDALLPAFKTAAEFDDEVIAEQWIAGDEYTATILGDKVLPMIRLQTAHDFYDYDAKYVANDTQYHCPCGLDQQLEDDFAQIALDAFKLVGASGWGRVDFMCDSNDQPWFIEVNTVPGMTDHSLVPKSAAQAGIGFDELVWQILGLTVNPELLTSARQD